MFKTCTKYSEAFFAVHLRDLKVREISTGGARDRALYFLEIHCERRSRQKPAPTGGAERGAAAHKRVLEQNVVNYGFNEEIS